MDGNASKKRRFRNDLPLISIITPTKDARIETLIGAIKSVWNQNYQGPIEHIIVGDDVSVEHLMQFTLEAKRHGVSLVCVRAPAPLNRTYPPARMANTRNYGMLVAMGQYISFLDDDNKFESNHLSSLFDKLDREPSLAAAYSWLRIYHPDESPWNSDRVPWMQDPVKASHRYKTLLEHGIVVPGDNIIKGINKEPFPSIDSNCWLFRSHMIRQFPWRTSFTPAEIERGLKEDRALADSLGEGTIKFDGTKQATVRYYVAENGHTRTSEAANLPTPTLTMSANSNS